MNFVLNACSRRLPQLAQRAPLSLPAAQPSTSLHTTPVAWSPRFRKYQYTPWPYITGLKCRRTRWDKRRRHYLPMKRDDIPKPGSEPGQITGPYCQRFQAILFNELRKLGLLFARQCEVYAAQRFRRCQQLFHLYGGWYHRQVLGGIMLGLSTGFRNPMPRTIMAFLGTVVFAMDSSQFVITDNEVEKCFDDLGKWSSFVREEQPDDLREWEKIANYPTCHVWQRPAVGNKSETEYRAVGTFLDISATVFFKTQMDLEYRKQWDKLVVKLDVIDKDEQTGTETLQWVSHYPFPFHPREYIYQRRYKLDEQRNEIVVISKSCTHPRYPLNPSYVRVDSYYSALLIRPHRHFDENGFDYVLSYMDDPHTILPKMAVQYAAKSSLPEFMNKLHHAAKLLLQKKKQIIKLEELIPISDKENVSERIVRMEVDKQESSTSLTSDKGEKSSSSSGSVSGDKRPVLTVKAKENINASAAGKGRGGGEEEEAIKVGVHVASP